MELTREQIEQMPAGREINNAVAEHVLGHVWLHNRRYGFLRLGEEADDLVEGDCADYGPHPEGHNIGTDDRYSSDIAAAWQVAAEMSSQGYDVQLHTLRPGNHAAKFTPAPVGKEWPPRYEALADDMALAICRAALLATLRAAAQAAHAAGVSERQ